MNGTSTLDTFLTRICAMQEECVAGSVANKGISHTSNNPLYWANLMQRNTPTPLDGGMAKFSVALEMQLRRNVPIGGGADLQEETKCIADTDTVLNYFIDHLSLTTSTLATPVDLVPNSVTIVALPVRAVNVGNAEIWASVYTLTFAYNRRRNPIG